MSFFGYVIRNGAMVASGQPVNLNGVNIPATGRITNVLTLEGQNNANSGVYPNGNTRGIIQSTADAEMAFFDAALSTVARIHCRAVDFVVPASTFAQTATITNGPRAANPFAWLECYVNGTSGRIPIW